MIQEVNTFLEFQEIEHAWDDLYQRAMISNLFLTHTWLTLWIKHFGNGQTFALLHVPDGAPKPEAGVVLKRYNKSIGFIENDFSAYPDFLATPQSIGAIQDLLTHVKGRHLPSKLVFAGVSANSVLCKNSASLAKDQWVPIFKYPSQMRSILISGTFDSYFKLQGAKFRSETRRKVHRAEKNFRVGLRTFSHGREKTELFEMVRLIEQDSWKARIGSDIIHNEKQLAFYGDVFERYAEQDKARIYVLYFNDQPVSFIFGILLDRTYYALKTSYRLFYRDYSPGLVLFAKIIQSLFEEKEVKRLEFLGSDARWKEEFSNYQEDFCTLELYPMGLKSLSYNMLYLYIRPLIKRLKIITLIRKLQRRSEHS
ncbi:MAG: GNAT family N-acetyltransferase [bacterium]